MDLNEIIQFRITSDDFIKLPKKEHYSIRYVDNSNYNQYITELQYVIELLHKQLDWHGIPTIEDCIKRFDSNSFCLLFYYNDKCIGWNWGNPNVTLDWINIQRKLNPAELYLGGCFVSKLENRPADAGWHNYNMFFDYCLTELGATKMYGYCDDWNKAAIRINLSNGWKYHNFL